MKKKRIIQVTEEVNYCDKCDKELVYSANETFVNKDGKNIYAFHTTCLIEHLKKTFIPYEE